MSVCRRPLGATKAAWRLRTTRASQRSSSTARARMARSKAVERWPRASRPCGLRQTSPQAEPLRLGVHGPGEAGHRPAGRLGQHHRHVVGGHDHQGREGLVDGEPLATPHGQAAGRLAAAAGEATVTSSSSRLARTARAVSILVRLAGGAGVRLLRPQRPPRSPGRPGPRTWPGRPAGLVRRRDAAAATAHPGMTPATRNVATRRSRESRNGRVRRGRMAAAVSHRPTSRTRRPLRLRTAVIL